MRDRDGYDLKSVVAPVMNKSLASAGIDKNVYTGSRWSRQPDLSMGRADIVGCNCWRRRALAMLIFRPSLVAEEINMRCDRT